ncbi:MAG: 3'-5' exonuclease [Proteobacteria bacterium]|nr:3'-5' exonuclease [Pseudomonadota bacterium]NDC24087.1 3'-5' exonuclease [Pseudomonadota bacterium]NDD03512.1 3'-5' exonuclease [Pseudomonadota bacterium]NDG27382.1 3'-5' exonuclease [Pseudomonadota bacterium]
MQLSLALDEHIVFDLETTGLSAWGDEIIEIGAIKVLGNEIDETKNFHSLVNPKRLIPAEATAVSGITNEMVKDAPFIDEVLPKFLDFVGDAFWVAHNARFDMSFIMKHLMQMKLKKEIEVYDTMIFSRKAFPGEPRHNLDMLCQRLDLKFDPATRHRSMTDVELTAKAFVRLKEMLGDKCPGREKYSI